MVNLGLLHDQPTSVEQTRASGPRSKRDTEAMLWATLGATLSAMQSAMQSARRSLAC
jgi:hypothetical protein